MLAKQMEKVCVLLSLLLSISSTTLASEKSESGDVPFIVAGIMVEGACILEMQSASQEISLSAVSASLLKKIGNRGAPLPIVLHLKNCIRMQGSITDRRTGSRSWDAIQPIASLTFLAPADSDNPALVQVTGARGIGLRITDAGQNDIRLGERSKPQFLTPGSDDLVFYVAPERTSEQLVMGPYKAVVNFSLEYD